MNDSLSLNLLKSYNFAFSVRFAISEAFGTNCASL